jgi:DNA-binding beta-propeller fold protein YncE
LRHPRTSPVAALLLFILALSPAARAAEVVTLGRRLTVAGDRLVMTEPDDNRVVVYDIAGDAPRKIGAFGTLGSGAGELHGPHGATLDPDRGWLYVADTLNHRVQVFDVAGLAEGRRPRLVRLFGNLGQAIGDLRGPSAVALSPLPALRGQVFVVDTRNDRIQVFDAGGVATGITLGGKGAAPGRLDGPIAAAFDARGRVLYVAESANRRVSAFDAVRGAVLFAFGEGGAPIGGLAVDAQGVVHVTDVGARAIRRFQPVRGAGGLVTSMRPAGALALPAGSWRSPGSVAVDSRGRVYVSDSTDGRAEVFSAAGAPVAAFGGDVDPTPAGPDAAAAALPPRICSNGGTFRVDVLSAPSPLPVGRLFDLEVRLHDACADGAPLESVVLRADAAMPGHGHGMNTQPRTSALGGGRYVVTGFRFHMPGEWDVRFDVIRGKTLERAEAAVMVE